MIVNRGVELLIAKEEFLLHLNEFPRFMEVRILVMAT